MTCVAIRTIVLYGAEAMFDVSRCTSGRSLLTNCFVRMCTGPECKGTTFLSPGNILRINRSIKGVPSSTSTARFSAMPNGTLICKSPMQTERRIVPKSCIGYFISLHNLGTDRHLILGDHFLGRKVSLIILREALVSSRHMCGFNRLELIST